MPGLFQTGVFQSPLLFQTAPVVFGRYRALTDIYLPDCTYVEAGTIFNGPGNWIPPTMGVDPIDTNGIQAYWNLGPVTMSDAEIWQPVFPYGSWSRRSGVLVYAPKVYWKPAPGGFILTGDGAALGVKAAL